MGDGADLEDGAVGSDLAGNYRRDRTIDVAGGKRASLYQKCHVLRVSCVAIHVNETWLNDRVAGQRNPAVAAQNNVRLEDVIVAEDGRHPRDPEQPAQRFATTKAN